MFGVVFVALIALLGGYWWKVSSEIARLNGEIAQAEAEKIRLAAVIVEGQRYKREKEELESRVNAIEQIARDQARPTYLMDAMADVLPPDLWLSRIEEKGQQLRFAGTTYLVGGPVGFHVESQGLGEIQGRGPRRVAPGSHQIAADRSPSR